jgi:hypothetical protein
MNGTLSLGCLKPHRDRSKTRLVHTRAGRFAVHEAGRHLDGVSYLNSNQQEGLKVTKTTKAILAGAAFAGLFAGTGAAVKASTLLPSLRASSSASDQDQNQDQKSEKAKDKKDRHACKGQNSCKGKGGCKEGDNGCKGKNSCKGKGGCRTDGGKKPS